MDRDALSAIRQMLRTRTVLCMAATIDGEPVASLLPFVAAADCRSLYVQASTLARHSRALQPGATVGLLIHDPDTGEMDPLQLSRLSVQATVELLERGSAPFRSASEEFVHRHPTAEMTLQLEDFSLYRLVLGRGRFVAGFAQAYNVGPDTFDGIGRLEQ